MHLKRAVIGAGLVVGVVGNLVVRSPQVPGLVMLLFFAVLAAAIGALARLAGRPPSGEARAWIATGVLLSSAFVFRASPALQFIAFLAASAAFAVPALRAGAAWMRGSGVADYVEAVAGAVGLAGLGAFRLVGGAHLAGPSTLATAPGDGTEGRSPGLAALLRGILLAAPLLIVFGALFASADRVFADLVASLVGTAMNEWLSHVLVTGIVAWLATGYLTGFLTGTRLRDVVELKIRRPSLGIVEIGVALGLVCALFAAFIGVQFRYLFGGAGLVEVTPGLTYAAYAREGFGQLAVASALVIPALLVSDWLLGEAGTRARAVFRTLGGLQLLLLALVILSAFQRVRAYQEAYGLTEFRFYGVAFLGWITVVGAWFAVTVLRGRRERFASMAVLSGFALVGVLIVANPDTWIARSNLARGDTASAHGGDPNPAPVRDIDLDYLASLGPDAVPTLVDALPTLTPAAQCRLSDLLIERWGGNREPDWRGWNLAEVRARTRVRTVAPCFRQVQRPDAAPPAPRSTSPTLVT